MLNVRISEEEVIEMLVNRVRYWTQDEEVVELYEAYYEDVVYGGCFDGIELNVGLIVDNDYINYSSAITKEEFEDWNIEDENDEKILCHKGDLFLVQTY